MAHAVSIAKLTNPARVDWALGHDAVHQRFGEGDLASILARAGQTVGGHAPGPAVGVGEAGIPAPVVVGEGCR